MDDPRNFRGSGTGKPVQLLRFRKASAPDGPSGADSGDAHTDAEGAVRKPSSGELSSADLFGLLWRGLSDIVGTAAAATLLRRSAQRALPRWPELAALCIVREQLEYRYSLPANWEQPVTQQFGALSEVARELWPLLVDLTGAVVIQRLAQIPGLRGRGILPPEEAPP